MQELMQLIENRQSARGLFDPERAIPAEDMEKILEAARWTPTAHNMQNFEIVVVDDKQPLAAISEIKVPVDPTFIRENYPQLSFPAIYLTPPGPTGCGLVSFANGTGSI
jgi:nitroreductase